MVYTVDLVYNVELVYTVDTGDEGDHYGKDWAEGWNTFWKVAVARSTGVQEHFQIEGVDGVAMLDG